MIKTKLMFHSCLTCGFNHKKLNIKSCYKEKCRGEEFYNLYFDYPDPTYVLFDTRYDALWDWGIVLDPHNADYVDENDYIWIVTPDGQNIINWPRKYDFNFIKYYSNYSVITYQKWTNTGDGITNKLYSINVNHPLIYGLHFFMISRKETTNNPINNPEAGIGMYALIILQKFWSKTIKKIKYRKFIYLLFHKYNNINSDCIKYSLLFLSRICY